jgi:hypothetical protein
MPKINLYLLTCGELQVPPPREINPQQMDNTYPILSMKKTYIILLNFQKSIIAKLQRTPSKEITPKNYVVTLPYGNFKIILIIN